MIDHGDLGQDEPVQMATRGQQMGVGRSESACAAQSLAIRAMPSIQRLVLRRQLARTCCSQVPSSLLRVG